VPGLLDKAEVVEQLKIHSTLIGQFTAGGSTVINYLNQNNSQTLSGENQCKFIYLNLRSLVSKNG
jgi:hypothetical protein